MMVSNSDCVFYCLHVATTFLSMAYYCHFVEISALKEQNEQLQAATRSRLQASDMERQNEIEDLRMRLEAKEATIAAMNAKTSKSFNKKKRGLLRKKKSADCNSSVPSGAGSSITTSVKL